MTYNTYFGADLTPILQAPDSLQAAVATGAAWAKIQASDVPQRAARIADEIAFASPALVGLQEVAQWSVGPTASSTQVRLDFLQSLLDRLAHDRAKYTVVAIQPDLDTTAPMLDQSQNLSFIRILDRDVMLARTDLSSTTLQITNVHGQAYSTLLTVPTALGPFTIPRSYISADVKLHGNRFRFITTHLESFESHINAAQGLELIDGPGNTTMPVVALGDFNSSANGGPDTSGTYPALLNAGFEDVWASVHPRLPGNTCCQEEDLGNPISQLYERVDLVMVKGGVDPIWSFPVNTRFFSQPFWPSDHAGVAAVVRVPVQASN